MVLSSIPSLLQLILDLYELIQNQVVVVDVACDTVVVVPDDDVVMVMPMSMMAMTMTLLIMYYR